MKPWIRLDIKDEWWGYLWECPYCGHQTLDAGNFCSCCGEMIDPSDGEEA